MVGREMGFDASLLKSVLEQFVDEIGEESVDLIEDRPRFAHAVVVVTDASGEMCQASCIRQLDDVILHETSVANVNSEWMDEEIQRALRELTESRGLLDTPRNSIFVEEKREKQKTVTTTTTSTETTRSATSRVEFPSMSRRARSSSAARRFH
ncbi:unnamed protein product [Caenorhabditis sp. 36 PRJEB53466]|nr:unnamed protein product [Caenorhabditis sp. 36 PRJEB53466]